MARGATIVVLAGVALLLAWGLWSFTSGGPLRQDHTVVLHQGAGVQEIATTLEDQHVVRSASVFMVAAQFTGAARHLIAGEYKFAAHASLRDVLVQIRRGKVVRHFVTIPEGWASEQVNDILMANPVLTGSAPVPPEGSVLPETYEVQGGEDRGAVLKRTMDAQTRLLAALWPQRRPGLPFATPYQAVILASIVEKETALPAERPRIAAVFINRLRQGIRLESDPTIIYAITKGRPLGRGIRASELHAATPYNTYVIAGLPPTPIANPGRAAIAAVLDPPNTDELYFVANGSGGHVFASTLQQHARNVAAWRQIEQNRGKVEQTAAGRAPARASAPSLRPAAGAR